MPSRPNNAFMQALKPSEALSKVVGCEPLPRTQVTKKLWDYIKANNLQDPSQRRMINADDKLRPIFDSKTQVSMFELPKLLKNHLSAVAT